MKNMDKLLQRPFIIIRISGSLLLFIMVIIEGVELLQRPFIIIGIIRISSLLFLNPVKYYYYLFFISIGISIVNSNKKV
ncbi:hypothetical protein T492DRAFT_463932 [Pavlovales sp. CCMP2436]|nr:hypothetical protein T492DRAFT_463932 [Pavlovales sp. CCMP2436]